MPFEPQPGEVIKIGGHDYVVCPHPGASWMRFEQTGAKSTTYQLRRTSDKRLFALKVFADTFQGEYLVEVCRWLATHAELPGMATCRREVLTGRKYERTLIKHPELRYAALIPWAPGHTWHDIVHKRRALTYEQSLKAAHATASVLYALEDTSLAHSDIASGNILVDCDRDPVGVELIDLEDLYAPNVAMPSKVSTGTDGYQHSESRASPRGQWCPEGDRFAGAVLLAEMLAWHNPEVRQARRGSGSFFEVDEVQDPGSANYRLMLKTLSALSPALALLFRQAWLASTLADCPSLGAWCEAITRLAHAPAQRAQERLKRALLTGDLLELGQMWPLVGDRSLFPTPVPEGVVRRMAEAAEGETKRSELLDLLNSTRIEEALAFYDTHVETLRRSSTLSVGDQWRIEAARQKVYEQRLQHALRSSRTQDEIETALDEAIRAGCYLAPAQLEEVRAAQRKLPSRDRVRA